MSDPGKLVAAPSLHLGVVAIEKKSLLVALVYSRQLYLLTYNVSPEVLIFLVYPCYCNPRKNLLWFPL